jgi:hypothetical protein
MASLSSGVGAVRAAQMAASTVCLAERAVILAAAEREVGLVWVTWANWAMAAEVAWAVWAKPGVGER